jgi:hypothetical protein
VEALDERLGDQVPAVDETNSRILNGSEMKTGGSIIMPMLMSVAPTTRSMIRKGRKIRKPIWKAVLSSEIVKAGMRT